MKRIFGMGMLVLFVACSNRPEIEGKTYCRDLAAEGVYLPTGNFQHCVSFDGGLASDNADTFFGVPSSEPEAYLMIGKNVRFGESEYRVEEGGERLTTLRGSAVEGTGLVLQD